MALRVSLYNGTQPIVTPPCSAQNASRAAVEWGPILLAATQSTAPHCQSQHAAAGQAGGGSGVASAVVIRGINPAITPVAEWLTGAGYDGDGNPLFAVTGTVGCTVFRAYFSLQQGAFSVYPTFLPAADPSGSNDTMTCGVVKENYPVETAGVCAAASTPFFGPFLTHSPALDAALHASCDVHSARCPCLLGAD